MIQGVNCLLIFLNYPQWRLLIKHSQEAKGLGDSIYDTSTYFQEINTFNDVGGSLLLSLNKGVQFPVPVFQAEMKNLLTENIENTDLVIKWQQTWLSCAYVLVLWGRQNLQVRQSGIERKLS